MASPHDALGSVGAALRAAGLTERALAAWAGTSRIAALPGRLDAIRARAPTPADAALALFVAGAEIAKGRLRLPDVVLDELVAQAMIERSGDWVRARVAIVPLGAALLVCDRIDAPVERDRVSWPDDSSQHLAGALPPGRRARWLDLACGSAYAPLARPALAAQVDAIDLNERAVRYAGLGARLSGIAHVACAVGDIGVLHRAADLVTCNAPIPATDAASDDAERWRHVEPGFFDRLWPALRAAVRPGGMIVLHAARDALAALHDAEGERVIVTYTPADVRAFAIAWWRPDAPARMATATRLLDVARPHVDPADREAALVLA